MSLQIFDIPVSRLFLIGQKFGVKRTFFIKTDINRVVREDIVRTIRFENLEDFY